MLNLFQRVASRAFSNSLHKTAAPSSTRTFFSQAVRARNGLSRPLLWTSAALGLSGAFAFASVVHLDSDVKHIEVPETTIDPATSIAFPNQLRIQSKTPLPTLTLVGVGVRTVSFIGIKVYSVGFYADLNNPKLNISKAASEEEKLDHIVRNSTCAMRIIPTRSTSYGHLRDGFIRALQARMVLCRQRNTLTQDEELAAQSPLRKFKSMFPNSPLAKHTPLDILLAPPESGQSRNLIVRDLGAVQNDWIAREFFLAYFEGDGLSPPLKRSVFERLKDIGN